MGVKKKDKLCPKKQTTKPTAVAVQGGVGGGIWWGMSARTLRSAKRKRTRRLAMQQWEMIRNGSIQEERKQNKTEQNKT